MRPIVFSSFIPVPRTPPPVEWRLYPHYEKSGEIYRHRVHPNRMLSAEEHRDMVAYCRATFGPGGRMPELGGMWFVRNDDFSFRREEDMTMFVMAFRG